MARTLSLRDRAILEKLAPELCDPLCPGSGHQFASILPPVSNHAAHDDADFLHRIEQISPADLTYLTGLIIEGSESINCMRAEHVLWSVPRRSSQSTHPMVLAGRRHPPHDQHVTPFPTGKPTPENRITLNVQPGTFIMDA